MLPAWGKLHLDPDTGRQTRLDLASHCFDVAAVTLALLTLPVVRRRMDRLAGRPLKPRDIERLLVLAFLHDIGKAARGFQSRQFTGAQRLQWLEGIGHDQCGHTRVVLQLFTHGLAEKLNAVFPLYQIVQWQENSFLAPWLAAISHHGTAIVHNDVHDEKQARNWIANAHYDPMATLADLGKRARSTWADAFVEDGIPLPEAPAFSHAFAGLVSLADWIASQATADAFPFDLAPVDSRWEVASRRAREVLQAKRIDVTGIRHWLRQIKPEFGDVFRDPVTSLPYQPTALQQAMADPTLGPLVIVEAETGSGKTEAALWRYASLFQDGEVDSLAFVLPTRVSAKQIQERIEKFMAALFPGDVPRPNVVLAVPGYLRVDGIEAVERLPDFKVLWPDDPDHASAHRRWAAEGSKRYLAAACAVGTIDQVLLSGLRVRHAHLRGFAMLRSLLVVDEVHASDRYMIRILQHVLRRHLDAGGHALLLSATLGMAARDGLMATDSASPGPEGQSRRSAAYPAITDRRGSRSLPPPTMQKRVHVRLRPWINDPAAIAKHATEAVRAEARVLIVRNSVHGVIQVQQELERELGHGHPALFNCRGVVTPHHGRYAAADRVLLDQAVPVAFGKASASVPRVLCGSQTLEQSLDIDADLIITDLAPMDVLLQRLGRLHRHNRDDRPSAFKQPQVVVLTPADRDLTDIVRRQRGHHGIGGLVYANVLAIEATWRALAGRSFMIIPQDNRELVEYATDPERLKTLAGLLGADWREHWQQLEGTGMAQDREAEVRALDWRTPWEDLAFPPAGEESVRTRLGVAAMRAVFVRPMRSPFGKQLTEIAIPAWMTGDSIDPEALAGVEAVQENGAIRFELGGRLFTYDRLGLSADCY